jgi:putative transposase
MILEQGHLYHIFNQGNNRQKIFFKEANYLFFIKKLKTYILPFADIIAWCLMPNHFHLMVYVKIFEPVETDRVTQPGGITDRVTQHGDILSHPVSNKPQNFNQSIAVLLRSYTRAINKQENRCGSLFREGTKAQCLTKSDGVTPSFYNTSSGAKINVPIPEKEYPLACFNYIHNNPVKANLVVHPEDWEFSSNRDYCGLRNGKLINRSRAGEFGLGN